MTPILAAAVLVELFTSEGCSSCPPADAVLARLHREQPVPGVQLIVLSEHVDYWNSLGWKDPFSAALFSDRQGQYSGHIYTPQAVVDGRADVLGSDERAIVRAVAAAGREPHGTLRLTATPSGVRIAVTGLSGHSDAEVMVAVVEDGLVSRVERGENAGRTLAHTAVVRALQRGGTIPAAADRWTNEVPVSLDGSWRRPRVVAFVQDARSRRILAAGVLEEERDGAAAERDQRGADDQAHGAKKAHAP
ncbi:MAG: DUF1223 domain-containing protein [Deltaproteobacteria bacterium]|nr:MAG: DUF1223 domain-containing protein [Deltaproteobacteria bacterium]